MTLVDASTGMEPTGSVPLAAAFASEVRGASAMTVRATTASGIIVGRLDAWTADAICIDGRWHSGPVVFEVVR